jgi:hypothetical protein
MTIWPGLRRHRDVPAVAIGCRGSADAARQHDDRLRAGHGPPRRVLRPFTPLSPELTHAVGEDEDDWRGRCGQYARDAAEKIVPADRKSGDTLPSL